LVIRLQPALRVLTSSCTNWVWDRRMVSRWPSSPDRTRPRSFVTCWLSSTRPMSEGSPADHRENGEDYNLPENRIK
ncbi:hypothetical protein RvY_08364, partial [Ramazzottius varieornatus]